MGTEILRPQDCLIERVRFSPCRRKNYYGNTYGNGIPYTSNNNTNNNPSFSNPNPKPNRKPAVRSERSAAREQQRKQRPSEPLVSWRSSSAGDLKGWKNQNLAMEKVTILRRGESLDSKIRSNGGDLVVAGTDRLGPHPKMVTKQIKMVDPRSSPVAAGDLMYAGSAFSVSPAPSSLPLPSFSKKKQLSFDDSATRDLRRLLRLDL